MNLAAASKPAAEALMDFWSSATDFLSGSILSQYVQHVKVPLVALAAIQDRELAGRRATSFRLCHSSDGSPLGVDVCGSIGGGKLRCGRRALGCG